MKTSHLKALAEKPFFTQVREYLLDLFSFAQVILNFIQTIIYEKYSGPMKITTHLDHISHCKTASGTNWSNKWTYRVSSRKSANTSSTFSHSPRSFLEREFFVDNLLVRNHVIIVMIRWTGIAPWEFEFPFPGSRTSTFVVIPNSASLLS